MPRAAWPRSGRSRRLRTAIRTARCRGWGAKLWHRAVSEPFNAVATLIFFGAILHTFLAGKFLLVARRYHHELHTLEAAGGERDRAWVWQRDRLQFRAQMFHFLGEVEAVFGIWGVPLALAITVFKGWGTMVQYVAHSGFAEPIFVGGLCPAW